MEDKRSTRFFCHECNGYITVDLDFSLSGNHVVTCPKCGHEHCRVIKDGEVTEDRWDQRNASMPTWTISATMSNYSTASATSDVSSGTSNIYFRQAWADTAATTSGYYGPTTGGW